MENGFNLANKYFVKIDRKVLDSRKKNSHSRVTISVEQSTWQCSLSMFWFRRFSSLD